MRVSAFIILLLSLVSFNSLAQVGLAPKWYSRETRLDVGGSWGMPVTYVVKPALDIDVRLQKDYKTNLAGILSLGYTHFLRSDAFVSNDFNETAGFVPIKAGGKLFLRGGLYAIAEVGTAMKVTRITPASLIYAPGLGFELKQGIDCSMRYESYTKYNMGRIAFKVSYGFTLQRRTKYTSWYQ